MKLISTLLIFSVIASVTKQSLAQHNRLKRIKLKTKNLFVTISLLTAIYLSSTIANAQKMAAGAFHSLVVCANGNVQSWGYDAFGQLGNDAPLVNQPTPVTINFSSLSSAGPNWAGTAVNDISAGTVAWANPGNAAGSNALTYATTGSLSAGAISNYLVTTNFGITVPAGMLITGIVAQVDWLASGAAAADNKIYLVKTGVIQSGATNKSTNTAIGTSQTTRTYGSSMDTWGVGLTDVDVANPGFGVAIAVTKAGGGGQTVSIDRINITVYYTATLVTLVAVAAGSHHSLALDNTGKVWSWGRDIYGQLGDNASYGTLADDKPTPVQVTGLTGIIMISAGSDHSLALDNTGKVWAWGNDGFGQLGDNAALVHQPTPVAVTGLPTIIDIEAGYNHSLALDNTGKVWSWGWDAFGQLGDNAALVTQPMPVAVSVAWGANTIIAISSLSHHNLVLDNTGKVWSWGWDAYGQLGDNAALFDRPTPVAVSVAWGANTITAIEAGQYFSLALDNLGNLWSWGDDAEGQLGDNAALVDQPTPVAVATLTGIIAIAGGYFHSLAVDNTGKVWSWGDDGFGQLGNNAALADQPTPVATLSCLLLVALPIELLSFTGQAVGAINVLDWKTASNINADIFEVERSQYGLSFANIGKVKTIANSQEYNFKDEHPYLGLSYYRLKQIDDAGNANYSNTIAILNGKQNLHLKPNPTSGILEIVCHSEKSEESHYAILDIAGRQVYTNKLTNQQGTNIHSLNLSHLKNGTYFIVIQSGKGVLYGEFVKVE